MIERNMETAEEKEPEPQEQEEKTEENKIPVMGDDYFGNCTNCVDW
jgi:hypothetical protein